MKKLLLITTLVFATTLLAACGNKEEASPQLEDTSTTQQNVLSPENVITMTCPEAIQAYLANVNLEGQGDATVQVNDFVVVDYIGRFADGTVFDTSIENIAKSCGVYTQGRDYSWGLPFTAGATPRQMIEGFDNAVLWMKINQTKTVTLSPDQAYGERDESRVEKFTKASLKDFEDAGIALKVGSKLPTMYGELEITAVNGDEVSVDTNHPMAGKELIFDITLRSIN